MNALKTTMAPCAACWMMSGFGAIRAVTPDPWGGNPKSWQMLRHHEKMGSVTNGGAKVVFIGDSITHFWESKGKDQQQKNFSQGDGKMLDLGVSGDRTERVIWRGENGELDGYNAKFLDENGDNAKWMPDHCHSNAVGYEQIWLPAVLPYFKEIVGR